MLEIHKRQQGIIGTVSQPTLLKPLKASEECQGTRSQVSPQRLKDTNSEANETDSRPVDPTSPEQAGTCLTPCSSCTP